MRMKLLAVVTLVVAVALLQAGRAWSASRATDVPNGFFTFYGGFASAGNTNLKMIGQDHSVNRPYQWDVNNLSMKNSGWGGMGVGYWFKQMPISIGGSFTMDFFSTAIKAQSNTATWAWTDTGQTGSKNILIAERKMFQFVPGFNLIAGVPLKFVRPYAGIGPAIFMVRHDISLTNQAGAVTQTASAFDAKVGFNAFVGLEGFISRNFSVFGEAKYSEVHNLDFQPWPVSDPAYHNKYDKLTANHIAIGGAFHF